MEGTWGVVVPVKRLERAKTRLAAYGDEVRQELALAFASDVVVAAGQVARVLVVTDDERAAARLTELGADVTADDPDAGLNPALAHGAELLRQRAADLGGVATVSADLPALQSHELRAVLAECGQRRSFVADHAGTGTTLLAAGRGHDLAPLFGPGSRAAHLGSGAVELVGAPSLRLDVDTPAHLLAAAALGVGPHTARLLVKLGVVVATGTVRDWDATRGGSTYGLDGAVGKLPPDALQDSPFRVLHVGQRVRVARAPDGTTRVALP